MQFYLFRPMYSLLLWSAFPAIGPHLHIWCTLKCWQQEHKSFRCLFFLLTWSAQFLVLRIVSAVQQHHTESWTITCLTTHLTFVLLRWHRSTQVCFLSSVITEGRCSSGVRQAQRKHRRERERAEGEGGVEFFVWLTGPCSFVCLPVYTTGQNLLMFVFFGQNIFG